MQHLIPHSRPFIDDKDVRAVASVVRSGHLAQGEKTLELEEKLTLLAGGKGAVAVSSGTAAIYVALRAMGVGPGTEVALPTYVCSAPLHALTLAGATPLLCDVDPETYNIDPDDLKARLTPGTACIIVPHLFGLPARVDEISALGVPVLEDCAMSLGALYRGRPTGSFGLAAIFSFYATKMAAAGEGGAVVSGDEGILARAADIREYDNKIDYTPRFNFKTTDVACALASSQLDKLKRFVLKRRMIAERYLAAWDGLAGLPALETEEALPSFYRFVLDISRPVEQVIEFLDSFGVTAARPVFRNLHQYGLGDGGKFPGADRAFSRALSVPIYPALREEEIARVESAVQRALTA